ncbi:protein of unknown function [Vibrio tapetis subsp. tapetis]|uniref:Uncharacterized protein n=1 Tax=Vibrio tapetis subsp. tapetis TaxID=1671868 RepID=A0A2N8ZK48_9VIBR|nr:protein of unknown function [Vibrio tapetis subsp. tapetis]
MMCFMPVLSTKLSTSNMPNLAYTSNNLGRGKRKISGSKHKSTVVYKKPSWPADMVRSSNIKPKVLLSADVKSGVGITKIIKPIKVVRTPMAMNSKRLGDKDQFTILLIAFLKAGNHTLRRRYKVSIRSNSQKI